MKALRNSTIDVVPKIKMENNRSEMTTEVASSMAVASSMNNRMSVTGYIGNLPTTKSKASAYQLQGQLGNYQNVNLFTIGKQSRFGSMASR